MHISFRSLLQKYEKTNKDKTDIFEDAGIKH